MIRVSSDDAGERTVLNVRPESVVRENGDYFGRRVRKKNRLSQAFCNRQV